jgi:hypothetical protein
MKTRYLLLAAAALLASCKEQAGSSQQSAAPQAANAAASPLLEKILSTPPAGEPQAIHLARSQVKPGDVITLGGRIMGTENPFVQGRAAFVLGDPAVLTPCNENPGDSCETPWDACCDTPEDKKRATASIQIVGDDGRVLKQDIEGFQGIAKLARLTVTGTVAEGSSAESLVINASAIRVGQ